MDVSAEQTLSSTGHPASAEPARTAGRSSGLRTRWRRDAVLVCCLVPGVLVLLLFHYIPMLGNVIAFQDYQPFLGFSQSPWVGLQNFSIIVNGDPEFLNALYNTLLLTLIQTVFVFPVPILLALLLNSLISERLKRLVQGILYLPHFLSWVVVVALMQQLLGNAGLVNLLLMRHGLPTLHIVGNAHIFKAVITSQVIWKDTGWGTIIFLAALPRIDTNLYEAAATDGAGRLRQLWHVTLPGLRGLIILLLILRLGDILSVGFEQIFLQQPAVGVEASDVLDTYVYNNGIVGGQWGMSAAVGLVKGIVGTALVLGANRVAHIFGEQGVYQS